MQSKALGRSVAAVLIGYLLKKIAKLKIDK